MAQGFKPLKRNLGVAQKEKRKGNSNAGPKVGKRIAPKKKGALQEVIQKKVRCVADPARHGSLYLAHRARNGGARAKGTSVDHALRCGPGREGRKAKAEAVSATGKTNA